MTKRRKNIFASICQPWIAITSLVLANCLYIQQPAAASVHPSSFEPFLRVAGKKLFFSLD
jgi:hypothetical protein